MSRKKTTDVRQDPIKDWNMDQETKDFLLDNGVSVYHSGGGCVHLYYKGWIINPNESVEGIDDLYALDQVKLNREVVFSQVWNDMGGDETHFLNDLENGFKFINQYQIFGDQFVKAGGIILRQRGTKMHPGENVGLGKDHTLCAKVAGKVSFTTKGALKRRLVHVSPS